MFIWIYLFIKLFSLIRCLVFFNFKEVNELVKMVRENDNYGWNVINI